MTHRLELAPADTCVWMSAGVLSYKLCDRHFECEHCPLDAALRGAPPELGVDLPSEPATRRRPAVSFPADRLYSVGHTWVQPHAGRPGRVRLGLDAFAASLIACPRNLRWNESARILRRDEILCVLEFDEGVVAFRTPVVAELGRRNRVLEENPGVMIAEPYGEGWIVDLAEVQAGELANLLCAEAARDQARLDLRRLRRKIALHLLADQDDISPYNTAHLEPYAEPWHILDGAGYLELVRELVH